jgi:hypothetical protein
MSALAAWLMGFAKVWLTWAYNSCIDLINGGIQGLCTFIISLLTLFPKDVTDINIVAQPTNTVMSMTIQALNWLFPMSYLVTIIGFVILGMASYFGIAPILRWFKVLT